MAVTNTILIGDSIYEITPRYKEGAHAMREDVPNGCNPYRHGSRSHDEWDYGHVHESCNMHVLDGVDVILAENAGREFAVPDELLEA
jgi:hypothetical protein